MEASQPSAVTMDAMHEPFPSADLVTGNVAHVAIQGSAAPPRKRQGDAPTCPTRKAHAPSAPAAPAAPVAANLVCPALAKKGKVAGVKRKKTTTRATPPTPPPIALARTAPRMPADGVAAAAPEVFDGMASSTDLHDATTDFVQMLDDNTVDIDQAPIGDYGYNEMDGGVHDHGDEEDDVEKVDEGVFDEAQAKLITRKIEELHATHLFVSPRSLGRDQADL